MPQRTETGVGGALVYRGPVTEDSMADLLFDTRSLRRAVDSTSHRSLAAGIGVHLRPLVYWPQVFRYLDLNLNDGTDLGIIKFGSRIKGRFDGFVGASVEVYAPDFGSYRYLESGVPGLRAGVRQTWYAEGWGTETTFNLGLVWRWGTPVDLLSTW